MVSKKKQIVTSRGIAGKDIMAKKEKELAPDFHKRIIQGRKKKGWDQRTFALKMNERLNIVQKIEKGGRPTDKLVQKIEKIQYSLMHLFMEILFYINIYFGFLDILKFIF
jgi:ribosome-binding protein aMBF1 (putative translation factor)